MIPTKSNSLTKSCGEVISSNCILYEGPAIDGVCQPATMTQVIAKVASNAGCCNGTFPPGSVSAYTGNWIDFSAGIPTTGFFSAGTWTITNLGYSGTYYTPQYKWTQDGDLLIRGNFLLNLTSVTGQQVGFTIPLVNLSPANFPANWTATNRILTTTFSDSASGQSIVKTGQCVLVLDYPTGILSLEVSFIDIGLGTFSINPVNMNVRFNNA